MPCVVEDRFPAARRIDRSPWDPEVKQVQTRSVPCHATRRRCIHPPGRSPRSIGHTRDHARSGRQVNKTRQPDTNPAGTCICMLGELGRRRRIPSWPYTTTCLVYLRWTQHTLLNHRRRLISRASLPRLRLRRVAPLSFLLQCERST